MWGSDGLRAIQKAKFLKKIYLNPPIQWVVNGAVHTPQFFSNWKNGGGWKEGNLCVN
jgi:hypothetical protein